MKLQWLVVLDPIEGLASQTDTSLAIINQARKSGISVDTATIHDLFFESHAAVLATDAAHHKSVKALGEYALILMRKEPPYDMAFHYATQLLSLAGTLVVNSPAALRDFNEKLIALPFSHHMPPTLVSSDGRIIGEFIARHGTCVVKSLDSFQGRSVQKIEVQEQAVIAELTVGGKLPVMVQPFLENVQHGDKRVIMLGDTFLGAALRRPKKGYHANFANSDALKTELTPKEARIVGEIGPWLVKNGIHLTGLDLIDEQLTEINITCPTGIIQISSLEGRKLAEEIVDYFVNLAQ